MIPAGAAVATALTVALLRPPHAWLVRHRLGIDRQGRVAIGGRWRTLSVAAALVVAVGPLVGHWIDGPAVALLVVTGLGLGVFVVRQMRRDRRRKHTLSGAVETTEIVDVLAAEIRAGIVPQFALRHLSEDFAVLAPVARVADLGGDVPSALREAAAEPGRSGLVDLAAAWAVSERSGAPLAGVLERLATAARFEAEVAREVRAGVEPARASGRMMAMLPLLGLLLGSGLGAGPTRVLTESVLAAASVALGVGFACVGVAWIDRLALKAESR